MKRWIFVLTCVLLFQAAGAQDWPLWRGNSSNSGFGNSGPQLPLRQQAAISSLKIEENGMIVANDVVYITTSDGRLLHANDAAGAGRFNGEGLRPARGKIFGHGATKPLYLMPSPAAWMAGSRRPRAPLLRPVSIIRSIQGGGICTPYQVRQTAGCVVR